jgi:hypothetical protein
MAKTKLTAKSIAAHRAVHEGTKQAAGEILMEAPSQYSYLSKEQLKTLSTLHEFRVDVHTLPVAKMLRDIERDQASSGHSLVKIDKVIGDYGVHEPHPYFSVELGKDGLEVINGKL